VNRIIPIVIAAGIGATAGFLTRPMVAPPTAAKVPGTAENRVLAEQRNRLDAIMGSLTQRGAFRQLAQIGDLLSTLDDKDMAELMDRVSKLPGDERGILLPRLMAEWAKRSPEAATAWIRPKVDRFSRDPYFGNGFADDGTNLIRAWAENAAELAIEIARQHAAKSVAKIILHNAIMGRRGERAESFEILRSFPAGENRTNVMASFFFVWAQYDRNASLAAAASLPQGVERDGALAEVLARLVKSEAALALEKYHELEVGNGAILPILVRGAAEKDAALAARTLDRFSAEEIAQCGSTLVSGWAKKDPAAAFAWAREHGIEIDRFPDPRRANANSGSLWRHELGLSGSSPLQLAAENQPDAVVAFLRSLPDGPERDRYIQQVALSAADKSAISAFISELPMSPLVAGSQVATLLRDMTKAQEFARQLPVGESREAAWVQLGSALREPLPVAPGPDRDAMLLGMARKQGNHPEPAWIHISEISDPVLRRKAFDDLACSLAFPSPNTVSFSLRSLLELPGVPDEYKKPWRGL
jgi:hypothetical protein